MQIHNPFPVAVRYNGNQLTQTSEKCHSDDKFLINIDYLILNLSSPALCNSNALITLKNDCFELVLQPFGTKTFKNRYEVFHHNEKIGTLLTTPHSSVLKKDLCQFQFENHLFYTMNLRNLEKLFNAFIDFSDMKFESINRLDIALDLENPDGFYQEVLKRIQNNQLLISGKDKKISPYYVTEKGFPVLTGFTIGSRSASRFLRVYNKSLEITKKPKEYILNTWENVGFDLSKVWRFEYQLNNTFFRFLTRSMQLNTEKVQEVTEALTWGVFNYQTLFQLLRLATKNHFDIKYNTGKSQTNKEHDFLLINWDYLKTKIGTITTVIKKVRKLAQPSLLAVKRMIKAQFREYYNSRQSSLSYILSLNTLFDDYDNSLTKLRYWFENKKQFYLDEFKRNQTNAYIFDVELFSEHSTYAV